MLTVVLVTTIYVKNGPKRSYLYEIDVNCKYFFLSTPSLDAYMSTMGATPLFIS